MGKPKIMVCGQGRHGKDTVCEMLRDNHGYTFQSSSLSACEHAIWPALREFDIYDSMEECFDARLERRVLWYELIKLFNAVNPSRLAQIILSESDIYCGIRSQQEYDAARDGGLFDFTIWVERGSELKEGEGSMTLRKDQLHKEIYILNDGTLEELAETVTSVINVLEGIYTKGK